jgi:ankyrin repeat protein
MYFRGTPLHRAALNGRSALISKLITAGADVNAMDDNG